MRLSASTRKAPLAPGPFFASASPFSVMAALGAAMRVLLAFM